MPCNYVNIRHNMRIFIVNPKHSFIQKELIVTVSTLIYIGNEPKSKALARPTFPGERKIASTWSSKSFVNSEAISKLSSSEPSSTIISWNPR